MRNMYDRHGYEIEDPQDWNRLHADDEYRTVGRTKVGTFEVSTVWLGIDHGNGLGMPVIFETMIFGEGRVDGDWTDGFCQRYCTVDEAREGHEKVVAALTKVVNEQ